MKHLIGIVFGFLLIGSSVAGAVECPASNSRPLPGQPETSTNELSIPLLWKSCRGRPCFKDQDGTIAMCADLARACYDKGVPSRCDSANIKVFSHVSVNIQPMGSIQCDLISSEQSEQYVAFSLSVSQSPQQSYCVVDTQIYNGSGYIPFRLYVR